MGRRSVLAILLAAAPVLGCQPGAAGLDVGGADGDALARAAGGTAEGLEEEQRAAADRSPEGIFVHARLLSPAAAFRPGERIAVELTFPDPPPEGYEVDTASGGIGQRHRDTVHAAPAGGPEAGTGAPLGVSDPLAAYMDDGMALMRLGASSPMCETHEPTLVIDLNERVRFERPGRYLFYVQSTRVVHERFRAELYSILEHDPVTSETLALTILPADPEWSSRALLASTRAFNEADPRTDLRPTEAAARAMRYLETPEAAREMAMRFTSDDEDNDLALGLAGTPYREEALAALEARFADRSFPVKGAFVRVMAWLRFKLDRPARMGAPPDDAGGAERWHAAWREHEAAYEAVAAGYLARLADRLDDKAPAARAASAHTLLDAAWSLERRARAAAMGAAPAIDMPPWYARVLARVPELFDDLPEPVQQELLEQRWHKLDGHAMLPALSRTLMGGAASPEVRGLALRRLRDVAPEAWRERVLAALAAPGAPLGADAYSALAALPDATLPDLDDALARRFERCMRAPCDEDPALSAQLLSRYATAAVADRVWTAWAARRDVGGDPAGPVLAYFAKIDASDSSRAPKMAREALARGPTGAAALADAAERCAPASSAGSALIERFLLDALDDDDPWTAAAVARPLGNFGSAAVEARLWSRLERLRAAWRGREAALSGADQPFGAPRRLDARRDGERYLEKDLVMGIAFGSAWHTDAAALARLDALAVAPAAKGELAWMQRAWEERPIMLRVTRNDGGRVEYELAHYRADAAESVEPVLARLARFARASRFRWRPSGLVPEEEAAIEALARARGLVLER